MSNKIVFCFHTNDHEYSMGIGFISAFLKQNNVEVEVVIYREISGKKSDTPETVASTIMSKNPAIVAFSVMTFNWLRIEKVIHQLRNMDFRGLIVVGGYHAILAPEEVLLHPGVDAVCVGEGELPLLELSKLYDGTNRSSLPPVRGIIFRGGNPTDLSREKMAY